MFNVGASFTGIVGGLPTFENYHLYIAKSILCHGPSGLGLGALIAKSRGVANLLEVGLVSCSFINN